MSKNREQNAQKYSQVSKNSGKNTQKPSFPTLTIWNVYDLIYQNPKIKYEQMEDNLGIDRNTIQRAIAWLKDNGYINKEHSKVKGIWQLL